MTLKTLKTRLASVALAAGFGLAAHAHLIDLGYFVNPGSGNQIPPAKELAWLTSIGFTGLTFLDKFNSGGTWATTFHDTTVLTASLSGNTGSVGWDLTGTDFGLGLVTLKDGQNGPNNNRYHIYGVSSDETLTSVSLQSINYFDTSVPPGAKNISHVSFWGTDGGGGGNSVPDGGSTVLLLGAGLTALGFVSRRLKSGSIA